MPDPAKPNPTPAVLGIAGGIGSGKSKVAAMFGDLGWLAAKCGVKRANWPATDHMARDRYPL